MATAREKLHERMNKIREEKGLPTIAYVEPNLPQSDPYKLPNSVELKELPNANSVIRSKILNNPNNADVMYYSRYSDPSSFLGKYIKQETSNIDHYTYYVFENGSVKSEFPIYYNTPKAHAGGRKPRTNKRKPRTNKPRTHKRKQIKPRAKLLYP